MLYVYSVLFLQDISDCRSQQNPDNSREDVVADLIVSPDIRLQRMSLDHSSALFALVSQHHSWLRRYLLWVDSVSREEDMQSYIKARLNGHPTACWYVILFKGDVVGVLGTKAIIRRQAELAFWLSRDHQGQGIIAQSLAFLETLFLQGGQVDHICFRCEKNNTSSIQVVKRTGASYRYTRCESSPGLNRRQVFRVFLKRLRSRPFTGR